MNILWKDISSPPVVELFSEEKELFTIVIVDPDAPSPLYLHLWSQNVSLTHTGEVIAKYVMPSPPNAEWHRYEVLVYSQNSRVLKTKVGFIERAGFDIAKLGFSKSNLRASKVFRSNGTDLKA